MPSLSPSVKRALPLLVLGILFVGSSASAAYLYKQVRVLQADPQKQAQADAEALIGKVSALIVLPSEEKPTIATVSDTEKLKDQPFFANAKSGDKVLIYTQAKKAVLYNPESNKIVEVAPVNIGATNTAAAPDAKDAAKKPATATNAVAPAPTPSN